MSKKQELLLQAGQHRYYVGWYPGDWGDVEKARAAIKGLPTEAFDRYDNPFEQKWALRDKNNLPADLAVTITALENQVQWASKLFGVSLQVDTERHYCGVFRYGSGDCLDVHVDAGIHPSSGLRKQVTALLYLTDASVQDGVLELWHGDNCTSLDPMLLELVQKVRVLSGRVVFFENNDYAWHGMSPYSGAEERLVVTVSYLSDEVEAFDNHRQRAFFVPRPNEVWPPGLYDLRDRRADPEKHSEVYRVPRLESVG